MKLISSIFILLISLSVFGQPNKAGFNLGEITENPQDAERICYSNGTDTLSGWKIHTTDIIDGYGFVIVDIAGNEVVGGFEVDEKYCAYRPTQCVESQEWTYGIDNTGTTPLWDATYLITLSDGTTVEFQQTAQASGSSWTPQMQEWGQNIQAAADAAGLAWFVDTRFRLPSNPSNLSGGGGFSGPPSVAVSNALSNMLWRYVNIQICPGQPVPVSAEIITHSGAGPYPNADSEVGKSLTNDGAVKGPIQKFWICTNCGQEPQWYLEDGVTPAQQGQIPNCYEPCGTLSLTESPPDRECDFQTLIACDNNNSTLTTDFINTITRRATVCSGEQIAVDYFQEDPNDPSALIPYTLLGDFVDCATGEAIALPQPECEDFVSLGNMYQYIPTEVGTLVEWWADDTGPMTGTAVGHDNVSNIFTNNGTTLSHVSGPADFSYYANTFSVEGSNASDFLTGMGGLTTAQTSGTDQAKLSAFFNLRADGIVRDGGTRTGERGGLWTNPCCDGDLELVEERTFDTTSADRGVFNNTPLSAGVQYAEALISDLSSWWNLTLEVSYDDGATWEPIIGYKTKPTYVCIPVVKCTDTGALLNALTDEVLDPENLYCDDPCKSSGCKINIVD